MVQVDERARYLHDRATRGEALSSTEQAELERWYTLQDQAEQALLASAVAPDALEEIRTQVNAAVDQLVAITQRIQELTREDEGLRQEIAELHRRLAQRSPARVP